MRTTSLLVALLASISMWVAGCSCEGPRTATQVVVVIDADDTVRGSATSLLVEVFGDAAMAAPAFPAMMRESPTFPADSSTWPRIVALAPENRDPTRIYRVVATASDGTSTVAVARVISGYVAGEVRTVRLYLSARCTPEACERTETCDAISGDCIDAHVEPEDLEPYAPDAGPSMDAGPTADGAVDACPGGCDDEIECTLDVCTASGCTNTTDDTACDDGESCTVDTCGATGCANAPAVDTSCDDGVYCNGADTCGAAGTCAVHVGNPCASGGATLSCNEEDELCEGRCDSRDDCPMDTFDAWSVCDYADTCDTTASRVRDQRLWACSAMACVETVTPQSEPCTRPTEGSSCGTGSCGGYGPCDYGDECDNAAVQMRTCSDPVCHSGVCMVDVRPESQSCSRVTTGMSCGTGCAGTCTASGTCNASCAMDAGFDAGFDGGFDAGLAGFDAGFDGGRDAPVAAPDVREVGVTDVPLSIAEVGSDGVLDAAL
jgi:hypothetical protein